jgi:primary-amine oxidase
MIPVTRLSARSIARQFWRPRQHPHSSSRLLSTAVRGVVGLQRQSNSTVTSPPLQPFPSGSSFHRNASASVSFEPSSRRYFSTTVLGENGSDSILHPLDPLTSDEILAASEAVKTHLGLTPDNVVQHLRFVSISMLEPPKADYISGIIQTPRQAEVISLNPLTGIASVYIVNLDLDKNNDNNKIVSSKDLPKGAQPLLTPEDCDLAEAIVQSSPDIASALRERYGITDMSRVVCDPWSVHLACEEDREMTHWREDGVPGRLVQTFLYHRQYGEGMEDNHYAHPIDLVPVVDLNARKVVTINGLDRPPPEIPTTSVQYHRKLVSTNSYLESGWRQETLAALDVVQPEGPSFKVTGNFVEWQKWSFRVGFNPREGLVLHEVAYDGRPILHRASLVEMAVPYADPHPPFQRKCAFDVGDYGLGFCANSLSLGCDCLGHIHYFEATLNDSQGAPVELKNAVCMHEEDAGVLWKHVEYRNGHNESRRARELIVSSIATVVNYEYLFYWHFRQDGCIDFKIKLSGELSTNLLSEGEEEPSHGVMVAPGVNAQIHQHMFCARLDMAVDSHKNTVSEVDLYSEATDETSNPYGNCFNVKETILKDEESAKRVCDANKARSWNISNAEGKINRFSGKPVAYKLLPFSMGPSQPTLLTDPSCAVSQKGAFATKHLWVTPHSDVERFPAGECTVQGDGSDGLPEWTKANRNVEGEDVVLWHAFGVAHVPRAEDFPVMSVEVTGFTLKPDGFFEGNPAIDLEPTVNEASELSGGSSSWCATKN